MIWLLLSHLPKSSFTSDCPSMQLKHKGAGRGAGRGAGASSLSRRLWAGQFPKEEVSEYDKPSDLRTRDTSIPANVCAQCIPNLFHTLFLIYAFSSFSSISSLQWPKSFLSLKTQSKLSKKSSKLIPAGGGCYLIMGSHDTLIYVPFIWHMAFTAFPSLIMSP